MHSCHIAPAMVSAWKKCGPPSIEKEKILDGKELPPFFKVVSRDS